METQQGSARKMRFNGNRYHMYICIPGTQLTTLLDHKFLILWVKTLKTRVIWFPDMYISIYNSPLRSRQDIPREMVGSMGIRSIYVYVYIYIHIYIYMNSESTYSISIVVTFCQMGNDLYNSNFTVLYDTYI